MFPHERKSFRLQALSKARPVPQRVERVSGKVKLSSSRCFESSLLLAIAEIFPLLESGSLLPFLHFRADNSLDNFAFLRELLQRPFILVGHGIGLPLWFNSIGVAFRNLPFLVFAASVSAVP